MHNGWCFQRRPCNEIVFATVGWGDVVVLRTTGTNGYNNYLYSQLCVSVNSVETILFNNVAAANDPYVLKQIANAKAIFIAGGNQYTHTQYWNGTPVESLLNYFSSVKKIPIGGTIAGMAILGWSYNSAQAGRITSAQALANPFSSLVTLEMIVSSNPIIREVIQFKLLHQPVGTYQIRLTNMEGKIVFKEVFVHQYSDYHSISIKKSLLT